MVVRGVGGEDRIFNPLSNETSQVIYYYNYSEITQIQNYGTQTKNEIIRIKKTTQTPSVQLQIFLSHPHPSYPQLRL